MSSELIFSQSPVGHRHLQNKLPQVLRETVEQGLIAPLTNHGVVDAYLVPPDVIEAFREMERKNSVLTMLVAAERAEVAIPSETLRQRGIKFEFDADRLHWFTTTFPVEITHDENGLPLRETPPFKSEYIPESDFEISI